MYRDILNRPVPSINFKPNSNSSITNYTLSLGRHPSKNLTSSSFGAILAATLIARGGCEGGHCVFLFIFEAGVLHNLDANVNRRFGWTTTLRMFMTLGE